MGHCRLWAAFAAAAVGCSSYGGTTPDPGSGSDGGVLPDGGGTNPGDDGGAGSCTANVQSDPRHCGACNHDCLGGQCVAGSCHAILLGESTVKTTDVEAVVVDDENVYWASGESVFACPKTGCTATPATLATQPGQTILALALDGGTLFFTDGASIFATAASGGAGITNVVGPRSSLIAAFAVDASGVYWTEGSPKGSMLLSCSRSSPCTMGTPVATNGTSRAMTISRGVLYFEDGVLAGTMKSCTVPTCAALTTLADFATGGITTSGYHARARVQGNDLLWVDNLGVKSCAVTGCANVATVLDTVVAGDAVADDTALYVLTQNALSRCPRTGCLDTADAHTLATTTNGVSAAIDDTAVYFSDGAAIFRIAK